MVYLTGAAEVVQACFSVLCFGVRELVCRRRVKVLSFQLSLRQGLPIGGSFLWFGGS